MYVSHVQIYNNNLFSGDDELKIDSGADDDFDDIDDSIHTNNISKYAFPIALPKESQTSVQPSITHTIIYKIFILKLYIIYSYGS